MIIIREFIATNAEAPKIKVDNNLYSEVLGFKYWIEYPL